VSRPIFLLALLAWLWRLVVVMRLFQRIAGIDLRFVPTHPDGAGGLGFVERLPAAFAPFFLGIAVVIAGRWAHEALYHGVPVGTFRLPAILLTAGSVLIGVGPLVFFAGKLAALKQRSRVAVEALLADHGRLFERRWIRNESVEDAQVLEAPEIGPVADTVGLYEVVRRMRIVPISRVSILPIALAVALPLVGVFATQMPLKDALLKVLAPLMGL
jgi:hypothetical protein